MMNSIIFSWFSVPAQIYKFGTALLSLIDIFASTPSRVKMARPRRVIVLCDGTWCGRETNTKSNIYYLARMIGINTDQRPAEYSSPSGDIRAKYFDGVGLGGDFWSYLWNGALATKAKEECTDVYKFIAKNFTSYPQGDPEKHPEERSEVWMFGISRGAYIVRSVAGMINNCGIIRDRNSDDLIEQVYDLYRSPYAVNRPNSAEMVDFRERVSHVLSYPAVKFMGLFDTVGSRGVPSLNYNTGTGFEWPQFHDNEVSSEVEKVYHAVSLHDRLWAFQPCLASRNSRHNHKTDLKIHQKWFPGCHYDLARQEFQWLRERGGLLERFLFPILKILSNTVSPNEQLADLVLLWILEGIRTEGGGDIIQNGMTDHGRNIDGVIHDTKTRMSQSDSGRWGSGDVYKNILNYFPGGKILFPKAWFKLNETAYAILFNPVDRMIPDPGLNNGPESPVYNQVYPYLDPDPEIGQGVSIEDSAGLTTERYPSETYQRYRTRMTAVGRQP